MTAAAGCLAIGTFYAFAYRVVVARWGRVAQALVRGSSLESRHSAREVAAITRLGAATVAQGAFAALLVLLIPAVRSHTLSSVDPDLLVMGAALGIGEIGLASFACTVMLRLTTTAPDRERQTLVQARGGWMGQFVAIFRSVPRLPAAATVVAYVAVEEVVFRAVVIDMLRSEGSGPYLAIGTSLALFLLAQRVNMPSWRAAMFPLTAAAVIGVVHGILFWRVPEIAPLVVAHATFILGALMMPAPTAAAAAMR